VCVCVCVCVYVYIYIYIYMYIYIYNLLSTRLPNEKMEDADGAMGSRQSAESLPIINLPKEK